MLRSRDLKDYYQYYSFHRHHLELYHKLKSFFE